MRNLKDRPEHRYTLDEYFALERASERRYEFWDGEIVCMSGGTLAHGQIIRNVFRGIDRGLTGGPCQAFTGDMAIKTPSANPYRYPDVSVFCSQVEKESINGIDVLVNPILMAEVLSPTTESRDRNDKRIAYQEIPSLQEYLVVSQHIPHVTHYVRGNDGWTRRDYSQMSDILDCPSIGIQMTLSEIYQGVTFE